ncbi:hypothetical protein CBOM_03941 [Ceraceosorus bombacis]|uniref:PhoD-like phosphatase domain-containing protein n=1 Tax=Ceraceosorus bombacis TaxID=401625 RepID=A0A0P1BMV2_9BASI|nr:hypothetical protein CBOM_03941 [Ceraceosorus bombacis]
MPTLNVKCGPMLKYDTVANGIYHAFALVVTKDEESNVSPEAPPTLQHRTAPSKGPAVQDAPPAILADNAHATSKGQRIYQYKGVGPGNQEGSYSFWRFKIEIPLAEVEQAVTYSVDGVPHAESDVPAVTDTNSHTFYVPGKFQNFRWAAHSCNGFSSGCDPSDWAPPDAKDEAPFNGANPLWDDVLAHHQKNVFHTVVGGGDQLYADKLMNEPELKAWHEESDPKKRMNIPLTDEIRTCLERFYFTAYCNWFGGGTFSKVIAQIPMLNMLDDHDLIDGFGTYPDDLMQAEVFNTIGRIGFKYYYLFQQFLNPLDLDGLDDKNHINKSVIIGAPAAYVQIPHHSILSYLGPKQYILLVDCRAERKVAQVCSEQSYKKLFDAVRALPPGVEHLTILLGVPLAYPRMVFLERTLSSSLNPLVLLAKGISLGFTNKFNGQVELLDDLGDHWTAAPHKRERNWLVERVQELALEKHLRTSYLSGDVHACGVGVFHGYHAHDPALDPKYALAVITSAIVNAPPPPPVISMLNKLSRKTHRSLFYCGTKETMVPLFEEDLAGKKQNDKYILGARNWCAVDYFEDSGDLQFDLRVEKEKGRGAEGTKSYPVRTPKPKWNIAKEHHHLLHTKKWGEIMGGKKGAHEKGHSDDGSQSSHAS